MLQNLLGNLASDATQAELLSETIMLLAAIVRKMPRLDVSDRLLINGSESTVGISAGTTLSILTSLQTLGVNSRVADGMPTHMGNAGAMHLYNNILIS